MENKTLTDIYLICKGWYNNSLYKNELEAMNSYYHKHYGCNDITVDVPFAFHLFLKPLALEIIKRDPDKAKFLFRTCHSKKIINYLLMSCIDELYI